MKQLSIQEIAGHVNGKVSGNEDVLITGLEEIELAQPGQLTFIGSAKYLKFWPDSGASAVLVDKDLNISPGKRTVIHVESADLALVPLLELFSPPPPRSDAGVHSTAVVDSSVDLGKNVSIGPGCYLGPGVKIGDNTVLYANVTIMDESTVGAGTVIWPGVVVREHCHIGADCIIYQNVAIGADGFGYRPAPDKKSLVKIPQIGGVLIGDRVEIGANTCIDRAKFSMTRVGDGTKIDGLVHLGHNVCIGQSCIICGCVAIAGSTIVGDFATIGGAVSVRDHLKIGDHATVNGGSIVISDVDPHQMVSGSPAAPHKTTLRQWAAIRKLPDVLKNLNPSK